MMTISMSSWPLWKFSIAAALLTHARVLFYLTVFS